MKNKSTRTEKQGIDHYDSLIRETFFGRILTVLKTSQWYLHLLCAIFVRTLCQLLLFTTESTKAYDRNETTARHLRDRISINNSAEENHSSMSTKKTYRTVPDHPSSREEYTRHRLPKSNSHHARRLMTAKPERIANITRVTVRSMSHQNLNRTESRYTPDNRGRSGSSIFGSVNSHVMVTPIASRHPSTDHQLDLKHSHAIRINEQLADALCHRSHEPVTWINRGLCCGHCRPVCFPMVPIHHLEHPLPLSLPHRAQRPAKESSTSPKQSPAIDDASEALLTPYSVSPSIQSYASELADDDLSSIDGDLNDDTHEYDPSIYSFPEHDTPLSQRSEHLVDDETQLKLDAQMLVEDLMRDAREKYQRMLTMTIEQEVPKGALNIEKPTMKSKQKSVLIVDDSHRSQPIDLCRELCQKLNLSDVHQVNEIVQILASNAPHFLRQDPLATRPPTSNQEQHRGLCQHMLLHPPFKPKRLIYLCPDGGIQILSAVDDQTNDTQLIDQQNQHLNFSNSAMKSSTLPPNDSSLAVEYETTTTTTMTTVNLKSNAIRPMMSTESNLTDQSHCIPNNHFDCPNIEHRSISPSQRGKASISPQQQLPTNQNRYFPSTKNVPGHHQQRKNTADNPIVNINLDLLGESASEDESNSLPELFIKRIIVPEASSPVCDLVNRKRTDKTFPTRHRRARDREQSKVHHFRSHTSKR